MQYAKTLAATLLIGSLASCVADEEAAMLLDAADDNTRLEAEPSTIGVLDLPDGGELTFIDQGDGVGILEVAPVDAPSWLEVAEKADGATPLDLWVSLSDQEAPIELEVDHARQFALGRTDHDLPRILDLDVGNNPSGWGGANCTYSTWQSAFNGWTTGRDGVGHLNQTSGDGHSSFIYNKNSYWAGVCYVGESTSPFDALQVQLFYRLTSTWYDIYSGGLGPGERLRYDVWTSGLRDYRLETHPIFYHGPYRKSVAWGSLGLGG